MIFAKHKPRIIDCYASEEKMCVDFWRDVHGYMIRGLIEPFAIVCISNNQRGGNIQAMIRQKKDKALGVTRGVADYRVDAANGYLEAKHYALKTVKNAKGEKVDRIVKTAQSPEQKDFQAWCIKRGIKYEVFYTPSQGMAILQHWGVIK